MSGSPNLDERKALALRERQERVHRQLERLWKQRDLETRVEEKDRLDALIEEKEHDLRKIESESTFDGDDSGTGIVTDDATVVEAPQSASPAPTQKSRLERLMFSLGIAVALLTITGAVLDLPGKWKAARELQGVVFHLDEDGGRVLEKGLALRLVETGASTDTNDHGEFRLTLPAFFGAGEKVTVAVEKEGWLVRYPFDGKVRIPADPRKDLVEVELLPKGSRKFLDDDGRIERFIAETAKEAVRQQVATQQGGRQQEGIDFSRAIREWASHYGLNAKQAKAEVDRWVVEIGLRSDDERQLGLAQIYEKNFAKAAEHFDLAARGRKERLAQIEKEEERLGAEKAQTREELVDDLWLEAGAHSRAYRFEESIATWREALGYTSRETSASQWAGLQNGLGIALRNQGTRTAGEEGARLLGEAVEAYRLALIVFAREDLPQDWAMAQNNLGNALGDQGTRTAGEEGARLLGEAVEAYRLALIVFTREDLPQQWAMTQNNLGNALGDQGTRTAGEEGARLLGEAVEVYRFALIVFTRGDLPRDWAATQNNLGNALRNQGIRTRGEEGARLLGQAVEAYRLALNVYTREDLPQLWASTQNNLGVTLGDQGTRTGGEESARLLGQAVEAYRLALIVFTREDLPQLWATTQNNLGVTLGDQGTRTGGEESVRLLGQAVEAYRLALIVFTRENLPQDWAATQNNLGAALQDQGTRIGGADGTRLLGQAVEAYRLALNVYTREHFTYYWGDTLQTIGHFDEAAAAFRDVLEEMPNYQDVGHKLSNLYHESLYDHEAAHDLLANWLARHPDDLGARVNFPEFLFTTQRYGDCQEASLALADRFAQDGEFRRATVLRAFTAASLLAQGDVPAAIENLRVVRDLVRGQAEGFTTGWTSDGTLHFVRHTPDLPNRDALDALFQALDAPDRDVIALGLKAVIEELERRLGGTK